MTTTTHEELLKALLTEIQQAADAERLHQKLLNIGRQTQAPGRQRLSKLRAVELAAAVNATQQFALRLLKLANASQPKNR